MRSKLGGEGWGGRSPPSARRCRAACPTHQSPSARRRVARGQVRSRLRTKLRGCESNFLVKQLPCEATFLIATGLREPILRGMKIVLERGLRAGAVGSPPPAPRTKWTHRVPHPVLIGHAGGAGAAPRARRTRPRRSKRASCHRWAQTTRTATPEGLPTRPETSPVSTEGGTRRVQLVREGGGWGGGRCRHDLGSPPRNAWNS